MRVSEMRVKLKYSVIFILCVSLAVTSSVDDKLLYKTIKTTPQTISNQNQYFVDVTTVRPDTEEVTTDLTGFLLTNGNDTTQDFLLSEITFLSKSTQMDNQVSENEETSVALTIRKCRCQIEEFNSIESGECESLSDSTTFAKKLRKFSNISFSVVNTYVEKLDGCSTFQTPFLNQVPNLLIIDNGSIYDTDFHMVYNHSEYCMELVGHDIASAELLLAFCPRFIPKCCQKGHYFDTTSFDCIPYDAHHSEGDSMLDSIINPNHDFVLNYNSGFTCDLHTVKVNLKTNHINGGNLCHNKNEKCYGWDKFCIDHMLEDNSLNLTQAAMVCPESFINKCCPEGHGLLQNRDCIQIQQSSSLVSILENHIYYVRNIMEQNPECLESRSKIIVNDTHSESSWTIGSDGTAIINIDNTTFETKQFCVDDYITGKDIQPILNVCLSPSDKEPLQFRHDLPENVLGKCCPVSTIYYPETTECKGPERAIPEIEELTGINISQLSFSWFPTCSLNHPYHTYELRFSGSDYAELTDQNNLRIVSMENNCTSKKTEIKTTQFCLDFKAQPNEYVLTAFVCAPELKNTHSEKTYIIVTLVGLSCIALVASFFMLVGKRVQRGITTVRKVNTLAGKILISYVLSQFFGYLALGAGLLAEFGENSWECFALTGFLQFFIMAAFCWNTSICVEGLLLTVNIRISEFRRYIFHSLWAWGIPCTLTALTFLIDHYSDQLPCSVIAPKIGVERCFFSNNTSLLVYFYVPISITVILNGVLLVSSRTLRNAQLKKLEHNLKVFKVPGMSKKEQSDGEQSSKPSNKSGLRTHQNKNMWMESLRLVLWSGTTLLIEVLGTLIAVYGGNSEGEWYNYLWYLPVGFNCLRGVGIFFLISATSEFQAKLDKYIKLICCKFRASWPKRVKKSLRFRKSFSSDGISSTSEDSDASENIGSSYLEETRNNVHRSLSTSTMISTANKPSVQNEPNARNEPSVLNYPTVRNESKVRNQPNVRN